MGTEKEKIAGIKGVIVEIRPPTSPHCDEKLHRELVVQVDDGKCCLIQNKAEVNERAFIGQHVLLAPPLNGILWWGDKVK